MLCRPTLEQPGSGLMLSHRRACMTATRWRVRVGGGPGHSAPEDAGRTRARALPSRRSAGAPMKGVLWKVL